MLSLTLKEVIHQIQQGKICAKELCEKCIARAARVKELNAFTTETHNIAKKQASASAERQATHATLPLDGVPVAVKDNFCTKGIRTTCASHMLESFLPPYNATMVEKLLNNGACLLGKTNLDEFGMGCGSIDSIYGPVRNPWNYHFVCQSLEEAGLQLGSKESHSMTYSQLKARGIHMSAQSRSKVLRQTREAEKMTEDVHCGSDWYIAGGSSGGSAVAVASGVCFGALGSDTGGSVRNPASYCGVVGFKPTYGRLSRHGLIPLVNSLDVPGIFTRTVEDAAILFNHLGGHDVNDSTTVSDPFHKQDLPDISIKDLCIGIPKEYHSPGISEEILNAWKWAADLFEKAGAKVIQVSLPHTQYSIVCYSVLCCCEVASNMARYDGIEFGYRAENNESTEELIAASRHYGFNDVVQGRIFAGNYFLLRQNYEKYFMKAQKVRRLISEDFQKVYSKKVDILLTPTTPTEAPLYSWFSEQDNRTRTAEQDVYTQPVNMAGVPAVSVPVRLSQAGLPVSLQLIGQSFKDHDLLTVAKWFEQQVKFPRLDLSYLD
ncbi:hypothetical protein CHS0354_033647 [Potamilus streckersoni]|uniref:Glutamyl-tRNA(Gln) amidotransferase subunit A, mitochondrial n=1 Tax=Potamilus streckersoni TaxID=2493646 RepID=A0AAE0VN01_9BIVA|nr:hypothetical protein CHS0354_033647 [Potamilus streckersoni]